MILRLVHPPGRGIFGAAFASGGISMKWNRLVIVAVAGALAASHAQRAEADAFVGGLLGGIIGGAIGSSQAQRTRPRQPTAASTVQRQQNREVQTALNHFGFDVGAPDGAFGPRTRAGISAYQVYLSFPATGQLTEFERNVLITAWQRAQYGGAQVTRIVSGHRDGMRGLLPAVRDELAGGRTRSAGAYGLPWEVAEAVDEIAASSDPTADQLVQRSGFIQLADLNGDGRTDYIIDTSVTGSAFWCNAQACTVQVFVSTPDGYVRNDFQAFDVTPAMFSCQRGNCTIDRAGSATVAVSQQAPQQPQGSLAAPVAAAQPMVQNPAAAAPVAPVAAPTLPTFFPRQVETQVSLSSHCNRVAMMTSANGGFTDIRTMNDPVFVLSEQFCVARSYAIAEGEALAAQVPGATPQSVAAQCQGLGDLLGAHVETLPTSPRAAVLEQVAGIAAGTGMSPSDLSATARICLSSGYMTDTMPVAIGSALLLAAIGETAYGEFPAQHLMHGIGVPQARSAAVEWFRTSIPAGGVVSADFAPGPEGRNLLLAAALDRVEGVAPSQPAATPMPVFNLRGGN